MGLSTYKVVNIQSRTNQISSKQYGIRRQKEQRSKYAFIQYLLHNNTNLYIYINKYITFHKYIKHETMTVKIYSIGTSHQVYAEREHLQETGYHCESKMHLINCVHKLLSTSYKCFQKYFN